MALTDLANPPSLTAPTFSNPWNPVSDISQGRNYLDTLANNFILKPATNKGINGYVFSVAAETTATADTDITDHYTEYNNFFQDHAALRPIEITLRGFAAENVLPAPQGVTGVLSDFTEQTHSTSGASWKVHSAGSFKSSSYRRKSTEHHQPS